MHMSREIYLVIEQYGDAHSVAAVYDTEEEAEKHSDYISEEPTNLKSWVEVRELQSNFEEPDTSIDIDIDESIVGLLGSKDTTLSPFDERVEDDSSEEGDKQ